jgi:hypothetical protein
MDFAGLEEIFDFQKLSSLFALFLLVTLKAILLYWRKI